MDEKIKVNITKDMHNKLLRDMENFEFFKRTGELNPNQFYTTLIYNFYETFLEEENKIKHTLNLYLNEVPDNSSMIQKKISNISADLLKLTYESHGGSLLVSLSIKPTASTKTAFNYIDTYVLKEHTISSFYRMLFSSYLNKTTQEKERILFKSSFDVISKALDEKKVVFFETTNGGMFEISPYKWAVSNEHGFNFLLGQNNSGHPYSFRLCRIKRVSKLNQSLSIKPAIKSILDKMASKGPQYIIKDIEQEPAIIELTKDGIEMFRTSYVNRPKPYSIDGNQYIFDCSYAQLHQYFRRFGHHANIISPKSLRDQMFNFYASAYNHYHLITDKHQ